MTNGGFHNADYFGYIPYIQLCVCYDKIGNTQKAIFYNNKAGELKPNNKAFFNKKTSAFKHWLIICIVAMNDF